jgi:protease I
MSKKALIITGNLVQDHEHIYPYYRLLEEGFEMIVALKDGKSCVGILGTKIPSDDRCRIISYEELGNVEADLMVLPGGAKAMEKLRQEPVILNFIKEWDSRGKIIASICHGAQLLISAKVVEGRDISSYYSIKDDVNNAGANYIDAPFVTSRNIVSSPHYKYLGNWMKEVLRVFNLKNRESFVSQNISGL